MSPKTLVYLSGPIAATDGYPSDRNVADGIAVFFSLLALRIPAISPHLIALAGPARRGFDYETTLEYCFYLIDCSTHVLMLSRWGDSPGSVREWKYATVKDKPIVYSLAELDRELERYDSD